jgi:hypothetical protein
MEQEKQIHTEVVDIDDLIQDDHNFNKGTEAGAELMDRSLKELGAGRSILIDKHGNIIAGNKTQLAAIKAGIKKVRIIETTGDELVAVKRTDVDLDSEKGRKMALADNATNQVNLEWDEMELANAAKDFDIDMNEWDMALPDIADPDEQPTTEAKDVKELKLVFTPEQYSFVLSALRKYGDDFTHSLLQILNINE